MKPISNFQNPNIKFLFTDIDGTMTRDGQIPEDSYAALWKAHKAGLHVVPVTGRPAGWCEMIARTWPVSGVIGENGGLYFRYKNRNMERVYWTQIDQITENRKKLDKIRDEVLMKVPGAQVASDQFARMMDLAIDFAEDVPQLPKTEVEKIVRIFTKHGAVAKVSNIHVNGWFGSYDKLSMCQRFLKDEFATTPEEAKKISVFTGDSPNDEPMFEFFPFACAVSNIQEFVDEIRFKPAYVAPSPEATGFCEIVETILNQLRVSQ